MIAVPQAAPGARVVAVHMEAINHCVVTRDKLEAAAVDAGVDVLILEDGETLEL